MTTARVISRRSSPQDGAFGRVVLVIEPETPADERERLSSLRRLGLLDTAPEERFDRVTRLAQRLFDVPVALVALLDADRNWFKSHQGVEAEESPRSISFCGHAIHDPGEVFHIADASLDPRFADNPMVVDSPGVRFYAGSPIKAPDGAAIGTLCVIDLQPREFTEEDGRALQDLAAIVEREIATAQLAVDDELTGLGNRRAFELVGSQALALCARTRSPALVVFADLNGLKSVNDQHGHAAGDELIKAAADALRSSFRAADVIARLGGDEFVALLVDYFDDPSLAVGHLEKAVEEINATRGLAVPLSLAIGTAQFDPVWPVSLSTLVEQADAAMYEHKAEHATES